MRKKKFIYRRLPLIGLILALSLFVISLTGNISVKDTEKIVRKTTERLEDRISILDKHINNILSTDPDILTEPESLPQDMVIYRYVNDSLSSWSNQFPVTNDDISVKMVFHRLTSINNRITSPLLNADEKLSYLNLGPKWYVVKVVHGNHNDKVIAGLEIKNTLIDNIGKTENGINPNLKLNKRYVILPLTETGGYTVSIDNTPLFKILYDSTMHSPFFNNSTLRWSALILFIFTLILFLAGHRTLKAYLATILTLFVLCVTAYMWGIQMNGSHTFFSPGIFADDHFFSLGGLIILNTFITLVSVCTYLIKGRINQFLHKMKKRKFLQIGAGIILLGWAILILIYIHGTLKSFVINSSISLELYKITSGHLLSAILVYISYTGLFASALIQIQLAKPIFHIFTGKQYNLFSRKMLLLFAFAISAYFSIITCIFGIRKEQEMAIVWANRLSVERDLALELRLSGIERQIAEDPLISNLSDKEDSKGTILNRIKEYYLYQEQQAYSIDVNTYSDKDPVGEKVLNHIVSNGEPIIQGSRFMFMNQMQGHGGYAGVFLYYHQGTGVSKVILTLDPKANKDDKGYHNILRQFRQPGGVNIPPAYSYAKYKMGRLSTYQGNFPYPTMPESFTGHGPEIGSVTTVRTDNHTHFVINPGEDEIYVISRPKRDGLIYFTSFSYLFLALVFLSFLFPSKRERKRVFKSNYFKTRINSILFISSFLLLSCMAVVSITFVYKRNEANMQNLMSSKVSTVQSLLEYRTRYAKSWEDLQASAFSTELEDISNMTKSDITLFTPKGKVFKSTSPEIFEKLIIGSRINENAFFNIRSKSQRFHICKERIADFDYWALYAPLFNEKGELIAMMCIPYTDSDYDVRREGFFHAAMIINVFLLLLIISIFLSTRMINSIFSPLVEMGKKMSGADINNLEYIIYKREDEISSLVDAYNRMVKDLSESTVKLAQAERNKAWSQMARQVAHEIKNPLTPIKLEIQRLIRLKENNNPKWEEKFDQVTAVVLEHIQILSDTANEFSTFAKLYTEEPVRMNLDKVLQDQILIFDNKENIRISYIGLSEAYVVAPKPQLIRVFVNLITNAIQAVEIQQKEAIERGEEPIEGKVLICLRNSTKSGYYDIVFDDNGPGVKGENLSKLFTPNFTTKSGGTGLGLAICRNIIEMCNGQISYQKSFALNGASFTVTIPKE